MGASICQMVQFSTLIGDRDIVLLGSKFLLVVDYERAIEASLLERF